MQQHHSITKRDALHVPHQTALIPAESVKRNFIALTLADLEAGLSAEQINWLLTNLNVKAMSDVLRKAPDPDERARSA